MQENFARLEHKGLYGLSLICIHNLYYARNSVLEVNYHSRYEFFETFFFPSKLYLLYTSRMYLR